MMCKKILDIINRSWSLSELYSLSKSEAYDVLNEINKFLLSLSIEKRIKWAFQYLPKKIILSSSFGIHSVVSLHLIKNYCSDIAIVFIDTGYLFPETYHFVDKLTKNMKLNLKIFCSKRSAAWQEARYGKLWEQGISGIKKYNFINKIEPMRRALKELNVGTWLAGLRHYQSCSRSKFPIVMIQHGVFKFLPIIDWNDDQIHRYIEKNNLEYHPLWYKGYVSVGDIHTTSPWKHGMKEEDTRFFGLQRECGLHLFDE